jgi:hypothetical protein
MRRLEVEIRISEHMYSTALIVDPERLKDEIETNEDVSLKIDAIEVDIGRFQYFGEVRIF